MERIPERKRVDWKKLSYLPHLAENGIISNITGCYRLEYDYVRYLVIVADGKHYLAGPSLEKFDLGPGCMVRLGPIRTSGKVAMLGKLTYRACVVFQPEEWWLFKDHNDMPLDYVPGKNIVQTRVLDDGVK